MLRHHFSHESEATRVLKTIMVESMSTLEFWHRNLGDIPLFTNAFVEKMAAENLPVKKTRGYIRQFLGGFVCLLSGRVSQ